MSIRAVAFAMFLLAFASFAALSPQEPSNPQVITRLGLALAMLEGTLTIDSVAERTIDKAEVNGHFYADKVPGHSMLALPAAAFGKAVSGGEGHDPQSFADIAAVATIWTNGLLSAAATALLFIAALRLGAPAAGAVFGSFALALATPYLGWSTAFFAHSVTGSLLIIALGLAVVMLVDRAGPPAALAVAVLGAVLGFTLVVDLTAGPVIGVGALLVVAAHWRQYGAAPALRFAVLLGAGGALGLLPLLIYNALAFGSPFRLGYSSVVGFTGMQEGLFGVTVPDSTALFEILFGQFRGLLPLSPILLLVPLGLLRMWRNTPSRVAAVVVIAATLSYLWINAGYHYWNGGWSTGPRHLVPMLPLLGLALCFAWPRTRLGQGFASVFLLASLVISLVCGLGGMFAPEDIRNPFFEHVMPRALAAEEPWRVLPVVLSWVGFLGLWLYAARRWPGRLEPSFRAASATA